MARVAVLLDGGCVRHLVYRLLGGKHAEAKQIRDFALKCIDGGAGEELFRIYYYDAYPFEGSVKNPLSGQIVDFSQTDTAKRMDRLLREIPCLPNLAFRSGVLKYRGFQLKGEILGALAQTPRALAPIDIKANLVQKGIDMKIGLDIAWLASKQIVQKIILVTEDVDFIPAMKFARREGLQVVLIDCGQGLRPEMKEHSDEHRRIKYP